MNLKIMSVVLFLILSNGSCKPLDDVVDNELGNSFNLILSSFIKQELNKINNLDKDKFILYVNVYDDKDFFRDSKIQLNIQFWDKQYVQKTFNNIYSFNGIDLFFGETKEEYRDLFDVKLKDSFDNKYKEASDIKIYSDSFARISVYFNSKSEVTSIDEDYYNLLKNKIKFDEKYSF